MTLRIYRPSRTATQSGRAGAARWMVEYEPATRRVADPLMGWTGSRDTMQQVQLWFPTLEEAKAHAEKNGWQYTVEMPHARPVRSRTRRRSCAGPRSRSPPARS